MSTDDDIAFLRDELAQCRSELAAARDRLEPLAEELAEERFQRQTLERLVERLADQMEKRLRADDHEATTSARVRRVVTRSRAAYHDELRQAQLIRDSGQFSNAWYLTHYPDVVDSGLSPALHYVRHGARKGYNPSSEFATRAYLRKHPRVAKSGQNPLVHYIERQRRPRED